MAVSRFEIALRRPLAGGASFTSRQPRHVTGRRGRPLRGAEGAPALRHRPAHTRRIGASPTWSWPRATPPAASSGVRTSPSCCRSTARGAAGACCSTSSIAAIPSPCRTSTARRAPPFGPGLGSEPADRRGRRLPDEARLRRDLVRLAGRRAGDRRASSGCTRPRRATAQGRPLRGRVYTQLQSLGARRALPPLGPRPPRLPAPPTSRSATRVLTVRDQPDGRPTAIARASAGASPAWTAAASSPTRATSNSTAASRRAASTRSPTPRWARPCSASPWPRCATACPGSSTASAADGQSGARRAPLGLRLRPLADRAPAPHPRLRGSQPRRGRGARPSTGSSPTSRAGCGASSTSASGRTRRTATT